ncbi:MAG: hypothetical protein ACFFDT_17970 [Candidatus Hodarchaeota archaeon]
MINTSRLRSAPLKKYQAGQKLADAIVSQNQLKIADTAVLGLNTKR